LHLDYNALLVQQLKLAIGLHHSTTPIISSTCCCHRASCHDCPQIILVDFRTSQFKPLIKSMLLVTSTFIGAMIVQSLDNKGGGAGTRTRGGAAGGEALAWPWSKVKEE
jgi:hypothetical protein